MKDEKMHTPQEFAALMRDLLHDRLEHSTQQHLALEAASLRAFLFSTLDALDHLRGHVERDELTDKDMLLSALHSLSGRIENNLANLEDVRLELQRTEPRE
jgi:ABC-type phosphate transport system auxiliary subunit